MFICETGVGTFEESSLQAIFSDLDAFQDEVYQRDGETSASYIITQLDDEGEEIGEIEYTAHADTYQGDYAEHNTLWGRP
ncbi:MAG: hypothetical protein KGL39_48625 [Patescibacteria group bacterium]|nr:hypothetical protein [Patescibacteria group bacterium]